jgi:hypothetical protein
LFENIVLRRIFGPKSDEGTGGWIELHNEELQNLYSSSIMRMIKLRRMRLGHATQIKEKRNVYRLLVGKSEGRRPLGRPRCRRLDNIKMDLGDIGGGMV